MLGCGTFLLTLREILVDGNVAGSAQAVAGKYTITVNSALSLGNHSVTARATDAANNVGAQSAGLSFQVQAPPASPAPGGGGTPGNNPIVGDAGNNVLRGTAGNDVFIGLGGNDTIIGGPGDDSLNGGTGLDKLFGDAGRDRLNGRDGAPRDQLDGGMGRDSATSDRGDIRRSLP